MPIDQVCAAAEQVTFFWNGNVSGYFNEQLETYVEIPSDKARRARCLPHWPCHMRPRLHNTAHLQHALRVMLRRFLCKGVSTDAWLRLPCGSQYSGGCVQPSLLLTADGASA